MNSKINILFIIKRCEVNKNAKSVEVAYGKSENQIK